MVGKQLVPTNIVDQEVGGLLEGVNYDDGTSLCTHDVGVGVGAGVDKGEASYALGVALRQSQGHVAAHAVAHQQHRLGGIAAP